jgi:hypothetical protein
VLVQLIETSSGGHESKASFSSVDNLEDESSGARNERRSSDEREERALIE